MAQRFRSFMGKQNLGSTPTSEGDAYRNFKSSFDAAMSNLSRWIDHMHGVSADIAVEALEETFGKALEYTPVASGELRQSGYLEKEQYRDNAVAVIGFGRGGNPPYAIYVHEMPFHHEAPTRSKFLQSAVDEDMEDIKARVVKLTKEASGV